MFQLFGKNKISSHSDYIDLVRKYVSLVENEFNLVESLFKKGELVSHRIPMLISLVNSIEALRGQDGLFTGFRDNLKGINKFQPELYKYDYDYNRRLENFILDVIEKENIIENKAFQSKFHIYLDRGLGDFLKYENRNIKALIISDRPPYVPIKDILEKEKGIELIITLGDLEKSDIEYLREVNDIPKIGIYGNHCDGGYLEELGIINLHLKTFELKGIKFGGFEGSIKYKESDYLKMYTQDEATNLFSDFERVDVLITHNPPYSLTDIKDLSHIGFKVFDDYIKSKEPKYIYHGHISPQEKINRIHNTRVNFVYGSEVKNIIFI